MSSPPTLDISKDILSFLWQIKAINPFFSKEDACKPNNREENTMKTMNKILKTEEKKAHRK